MKYIFLDFDGVINSNIYFDTPTFKEQTAGQSWAEIMLISIHTHMDPEAIKLLNSLVELSKAKVIVSSTWRLRYSIDELNEMLRGRGATFELIGATPSLDSGWGGTVPRGFEIESYINSLDESPESFVILDDINNMAHLTEFLVLTDEDCGLTKSDVDKALEILG